jgi:hypothetical protein
MTDQIWLKMDTAGLQDDAMSALAKQRTHKRLKDGIRFLFGSQG